MTTTEVANIMSEVLNEEIAQDIANTKADLERVERTKFTLRNLTTYYEYLRDHRMDCENGWLVSHFDDLVDMVNRLMGSPDLVNEEWYVPYHSIFFTKNHRFQRDVKEMIGEYAKIQIKIHGNLTQDAVNFVDHVHAHILKPLDILSKKVKN